MDMVPDTWHVSVKCPSRVDTCPLLTLIPNELQGSVRGQMGVKYWNLMDMVPDTWYVSFTCRHMSATNSASRWATGECEGSNQGKILPGMCLSLANTCPLLTLPPDELQRTTWTIISLVVSNIILCSSFASKGGGDLQGLAPHAHDLPQKMIITVKLCAFYVYF